MCHPRNVVHNLYNEKHSLYKFNTEVAEKNALTKEQIHKNVQNRTHGKIETIYDIRTVLVYYNMFNYKKHKLADICLPPYIEKDMYLLFIKNLQEYFEGKTLSIVKLNEEYIYLYYENECVNTMINNMIVYNITKR